MAASVKLGGTIPVGFNGAISPKLKACVSQDCQNITFSDVTLLSSPANPFGWTTDLAETPRPRIAKAFSEIRIIVTNSSGTEVINQIVLGGTVNFFPAISDFNDNMPLSTTVWGLEDGVYSINYQFTYQESGGFYGDPTNSLALEGKTVESKMTQVITCNAQNEVKDLWLKYLNDCCHANREKALEAEALLFAVEAAAACADEYNASRIKSALDKILTLDSDKCNVCEHSKCKC
tara:strand:+ start:307 stop:1008 length:702 start_codon:yes stop_codon:yes gene_type:complete